jgi:hypothetical protein
MAKPIAWQITVHSSNLVKPQPGTGILTRSGSKALGEVIPSIQEMMLETDREGPSWRKHALPWIPTESTRRLVEVRESRLIIQGKKSSDRMSSNQSRYFSLKI